MNKLFFLITALLQPLCAAQNSRPHAPTKRDVERAIDNSNTAKEIFTLIHAINYWSCNESSSGGGSTLTSTATLRTELPKIIAQFNIKTILDAPCGDYNWMKTMNLPIERYTGVDIVPELIKRNSLVYSTQKTHFMCADLIHDPVQKADLIICRDCLQHLSYEDACAVLANFKASGSTYLLITTSLATTCNKNIKTGQTYDYNLMQHPFNFPQPLLLIEETSMEASSLPARKSMALWKLEDIMLDTTTIGL